MTCKYNNINQHDALYNAARSYPGGIEALAQRMSTPARHVLATTLRNKLRPAIDTHHTNFEEVSTIIELLEEAKVDDAFLPLHAFCWRHNHVAVQLPAGEIDEDELRTQLVDIMSGDGALAGLVNVALRDRRVSVAELAEIEEQVAHCMVALVALRDKARAKHMADFPAA